MPVAENSATRTFSGECILRATVSTTGYCNDDADFGSHTKIVLEEFSMMYEDSSFSGQIVDLADRDTSQGIKPKKRITLEAHGNAELTTLIKALRFSADALEALAKGSEDNPLCD